MTIQIWRYVISGEKYVVEIDADGNVHAVSGPLHHTEVEDAKHEGVINNDTELVDWLSDNGDLFDLES